MCLALSTGEESLVNAIGGCCGTGPEHIAAIKEMASAYRPRQKHSVPNIMRLSGLEPLNYEPDAANMRKTFLNIGERCNVAGSIIYKKAIVDGNYDKAAGIALQQVWPQGPGRCYLVSGTFLCSCRGAQIS
jgi:5-methyltetrahydrofolate--homocysteine methyltransferase